MLLKNANKTLMDSERNVFQLQKRNAEWQQLTDRCLNLVTEQNLLIESLNIHNLAVEKAQQILNQAEITRKSVQIQYGNKLLELRTGIEQSLREMMTAMQSEELEESTSSASHHAVMGTEMEFEQQVEKIGLECEKLNLQDITDEVDVDYPSSDVLTEGDQPPYL